MQARAIDFVLTNVSDVKKAREFYENILGISAAVGSEGDGWVEYDTRPVALALGEGEAAGLGGPPGTYIALAVDDVAAAVNELRDRGVKILTDPIDTPVCEMAFIEDPDGNRIVLHKRKDGTSG